MDASAQPLARLRGFALSSQALRRLTLVNAVMLVLIVATGATVRLTGSGLGCEHWPGCAPHHFEPKSFHSYIEFSNRVFAFFTILVTLFTWALARGHRRLAFAIFFGTLLQAPLGALTVHFGLNPWLVLSHFLLSVVVLTLGVVLALEVRGRERTQLPAWVPRVGVLLGVAGAVLLVSGTLATAAGPHPGSVVVRRVKISRASPSSSNTGASTAAWRLSGSTSSGARGGPRPASAARTTPRSSGSGNGLSLPQPLL